MPLDTARRISERTAPGQVDLPVDPPLRIQYLPGTNKVLVVSMSGVGNHRQEMPPPEFFGTASDGGNHVLFVSDISRSWMNGPGVADQIVNAIKLTVGAHGIERVVAIGNSMGGTMALILPNLTRVDAVLAIVPQFSARQSRVPEERRWKFFRNKIETWPFEAVEALPGPQTEVTILHGGTDDEIIHLDRFPRASHARHYVFPDGNHRLADWLRRQGRLGHIVKYAIQGKPRVVRNGVESVGGITRKAFDDDRNDRSIQETRP